MADDSGVLVDPVMLTQLPMTDAVGLCARLEHAGIPSVLHEARGGVIAHNEQSLGSIWIEREDASDAREVMKTSPTKIELPSWRCAVCGETVEGQFAMCWNCGTDRGQ
jgi:hypothetical protein